MVTITVAPDSGVPLSGGTVQFVATVNGDPTNSGVTWSLDPGTSSPQYSPKDIVFGDQFGTINQSGLYTAPGIMKTTPRFVTVIATSNYDGKTIGTATVSLLFQGGVVYVHTRKVGQQWDVCDRCGFSWPIGDLVQQKGLMVCYRCWDNLTVERRQQEIMRAMMQGDSQMLEGADLRVIDRGFFLGADEEVS